MSEIGLTNIVLRCLGRYGSEDPEEVFCTTPMEECLLLIAAGAWVAGDDPEGDEDLTEVKYQLNYLSEHGRLDIPDS